MHGKYTSGFLLAIVFSYFFPTLFDKNGFLLEAKQHLANYFSGHKTHFSHIKKGQQENCFDDMKFPEVDSFLPSYQYQYPRFCGTFALVHVLFHINTFIRFWIPKQSNFMKYRISVLFGISILCGKFPKK